MTAKSSKATDKVFIPKKIAVDDGYAHTKIAWFDEDEGRIRTFTIPSTAKAGDFSDVDVGEFNPNPQTRCYIDDSGNEISAGSITDPESTNSEAYPFSSLNRVLVNHAIIRSGLASEDAPFEPEQICVTAPVQRYLSDRESILKKRRESLSRPIMPKDYDHPFVKINPDAVMLYPEAIAAWIDHVVDDQGRSKNNPEHITAIVDIGGRTTDITVFMDGVPKREHSMTYEVGMLTAFKKIGALMQRRYELTSEPGLRTIQKAVDNNGLFSLRGRSADMSDLIDEAYREVSEEIYRQIERQIEAVPDFETMIFVGGGSKALGKYLEDYDMAYIPEDPHLANVRGVLKYMTYVS